MSAQFEHTVIDSDRLRVTARKGSSAQPYRVAIMIGAILLIGVIPLIPYIFARGYVDELTGGRAMWIYVVWPFVSVIFGLGLASWLLSDHDRLVDYEVVFRGDSISFPGGKKKLKDVDLIGLHPYPHYEFKQRMLMKVLAPVALGLNTVASKIAPHLVRPTKSKPTYVATIGYSEIGIYFTDPRAAQDFQRKLTSEIARRRGQAVDAKIDAAVEAALA